MNDENDKTLIECADMTPEEFHAYNVLQTWIVFLDNVFCIFFVGCITFMAHTTGKWQLMFFYFLAVWAFMAV